MTQTTTDTIQFADFLKVDIVSARSSRLRISPKLANRPINSRSTSGQLMESSDLSPSDPPLPEGRPPQQTSHRDGQLPSQQIGKFMSEVLTLGLPDENGELILLQPTIEMPKGNRCSEIFRARRSPISVGRASFQKSPSHPIISRFFLVLR